MSRLVGVGSDRLTCSADPESFESGRNRHTDALGSAVVSRGGTGADVKPKHDELTLAWFLNKHEFQMQHTWHVVRTSGWETNTRST